MKGDPITGRAVVSIAEGTKLGRVDEVLVDTEELRVVALHVTAKDTDRSTRCVASGPMR